MPIDDVPLPFTDVDGVQLTAVNRPGYGWTLTVLTRGINGHWEMRVRYERLARPELADVMLQELEKLELEL